MCGAWDADMREKKWRERKSKQSTFNFLTFIIVMDKKKRNFARFVVSWLCLDSYRSLLLGYKYILHSVAARAWFCSIRMFA